VQPVKAWAVLVSGWQPENSYARAYHVLEQNFRCSYGEIDLVAEDEQDLIFVEVKTRRGSAFGLPEEARDFA